MRRGIELEIPGRGVLRIEHIVFDMNGTLTVDGRINNKVKDRFILLSKKVNTHVVTSDTFGKAEEVFKKVPTNIVVVPQGSEADKFKMEFVLKLGKERTAAVGNGFNDRLMFQVAVLSVCVLGREGAYGETLSRADVVFKDPLDAVDFFLKPLRMKATLRN